MRCVFRRDYGSLTFDVPPSEISRWRAVARVLRSPLDALSCALLPASCSLCGSLLPQLSSAPICDACWLEFSTDAGSVCARCGDAIDAAQSAFEPDNPAQCRTCRLTPPPSAKAVSYGTYHGRMKDAIHALKYDRLCAAAPRLGGMLAQAISQLAGEAPMEMLVVPVPLHRLKHTERGFNQARLLAAHGLRTLAKTHPQWRFRLAASTLIRLRSTENQAGLTPRMRRMNVSGAFRVSDPGLVRAKHVLVVDDILTTGATVRAVSKALLDAGAASVWVATLARARRINHAEVDVSVQSDDQDRHGFAGAHAAGVTQEAGRFSSHDQPSF